MPTILREYRTIEKSAWGPGPWQDEPDKVEWRDEATGFPCIARRAGNLGHWCGYVGLPPGHSLHGKGYDEVDAEVHGGLTFAAGCSDHSHEAWEKFKLGYAKAEVDALRHPLGDSAQFRTEWAPAIASYDWWLERMQATSVCNVPAPGESDAVWWLGFDCGHYGDFSPGHAALMKSIGSTYYRDIADRADSNLRYRDLTYVKAQCATLAHQLQPR